MFKDRPKIQGIEAAIENYDALLTQMGHSEDQVAARLKSLAPEISVQANSPAEEQ